MTFLQPDATVIPFLLFGNTSNEKEQITNRLAAQATQKRWQ